MTTPNEPQWGQQGSGQPPQPGQQPPQQSQPGQQPPWGQPQPGQQWTPPTGEQPTQQWNPQQGQPQYGQPQQGQPQYGQPQQGQPQYGQPQQGQPQYGQPQQGQPQYGQPQWGQPAEAQQWGQPDQGHGNVPPGFGPPPGAAPYGESPKKNKGVLITAVAVVVALLAGLGVYFFAIKDNDPAGQATPEAAAAKLFADVDNGDLIALTDTLDPVEAQYTTDLAGDVITEFKRLGLLNDSATVNNATGTNISIKGITFDAAAEEKPLPDLTIVKLTGGTLTINPTTNTDIQTDLYKQLTAAVTKYADTEGVPMDTATQPTTIDIAQVIKDDNNGEPIRISTVQRDGSWYPSVFYTAADYWAQSAGLGAVTTADAIGGSENKTPEAAVDAMIAAIIKQDANAVITLLPPDEMSAVHAYGRKIVDAIGAGSPQDAQYTAQWTTTDTTGGKLVSLKSLEFTADGETGTIAIDQAAGSVSVTANGDTQTFDADTLSEMIGAGTLADIHPNMPDFVQRMLKAALGIGIVTTEVDGNWYVSPLRTSSGVFTTLLGGMQQQDIEMFIDLMNK